MSSILDIGRSGLLSYRNALSVTSENIANVNTEGYHKRTAVMEEVSGTTANLQSIGTSGGGVRVEDIRRAFDELLADRTRSAGANLTSAETFLTQVKALETQLQPGEGGVLGMMDGFFDAASSLSISPTNTGLRSVFIESGKHFAASVSDLANGIQQLRDNVQEEADFSIDRANKILGEIENVQSQLTTTQDSGSRNSILDRRDKLVKDLSDLVAVTVRYSEGGQAKITLGDAPGGPSLINDGKAVKLGFNENGAITVTPFGPGTTTVTRMPAGGMLHGYSMALGAIDSAAEDVDTWAQKVAADFNAVHQSGLDLNGQAGGELFSLRGWKIDAAVSNLGYSTADVMFTNTGTPPEGPIMVAYDQAADMWTATDPSGSVLGQGARQIDMPGLTVKLDGQADDGDILRLTSTDGKALNMRFMVEDTTRIATASSIYASANAGNIGNAAITVSPSPVSEISADPLSALLADGSTAADAVEFLSPGVVGMIPAEAEALTLTSLGDQSTVDFAVPGGSTAGLTTLQFNLDGTDYTFDLSGGAAGTDMTSLAAALNSGAVTTTDLEPLTLAELGLAAVGHADGLQLTRATGDISGPASLGAVTGAINPSNGDASDLRVFTREGQQLAGPPMTDAEAAAFLTEANGFLPGAVYNTDLLNADDGYRGMTFDGNSGAGDHSLRIGAGDGPVSWTGTARPAPTDAEEFGFNLPGGTLGSIDIPAGASAGRIASLVNEAYPVDAKATTVLEFEAPSNGTLSISLEGTNTTPMQVRAQVFDGRLENFAAEVNALTSLTGIRAETSENGGRIRLIHDGGEDITLTNVSHDGGDAISVRRLDGAGVAVDAAATDLGTGFDANARFAGTVQFNSPGEFTLVRDGLANVASADPTVNGLMSRNISQAGMVQSFAFDFNADTDATGVSEDGLSVASASNQYGITLTGADGTSWTSVLNTLEAGTLSQAEVASGLAAEMRSVAPDSTLTGAALASLPPNGSEMAVQLGDDLYTLRMENGSVAVSGPEQGRLTASFDASNRLVVSTNGGSLDGAPITVASPAIGADVFGASPAMSPTTQLTGQEIDFSTLPGGTSQFTVSIGGTDHVIDATNAGGSVSLSVPAGFPGTASFDGATNKISFQIDAAAGAIRIPSQFDAQSFGFNTMDAKVVVQDGVLSVTATDNRALEISASASSVSGSRLTMSNLPDEDLIVSMAPGGAQRLAGTVDLGSVSPLSASVDLVVTDAENGMVDVVDASTGDVIASRQIDEFGSLNANGMQYTLNGILQTGDRFQVRYNSDGTGDARAIEDLADLRLKSPDVGSGGFGQLYNTIINEAGSQVIAAKDREESAVAVHETAMRAHEERSGVDLDEEAAKLIQQQQAYQASAQVFSVARQLFDTLMNSI